MAGNDFLPHMACLRIDDGGILRLIQLYNTIKPQIRGFLTNTGSVEMSNFSVFLEELARAELTILTKM